MLVSVIIPVYNTEQYLSRCVDSVLRQTYAKLEVILVDDGSNDGSNALCRSLASMDSRVKVVTIAHSGVAAARNAGLAVATGERITFVDSDDAVSPLFIEQLSALIDKYDADISECEWIEFYDVSKPILGAENGYTTELRFSQTDAIFSSLYQETLKNSLCRRLFRAEIFRDFKFKEGQVFEDLWSEYPLLSRASRGVAYSSSRLYYYIRRHDSTMGDFSPSRTVVLGILSDLEARVSREAPQYLPAVRSRLLSASFNMISCIPSSGPDEYRCTLNSSWNNVRRLRAGCLRDSRVRKINKLAILLSYSGRWTLRHLLRLGAKLSRNR